MKLFKFIFMLPVAVAVAVLAGPAITQSTVSVEYNVDRPGYDYRQFDLPAADPNLCRNYCASDGQCRAFTYVVPGVQGPYARCWLKTAVPPPASRNCCVSGVKAAGPVVAPSIAGVEYNVDRPGYDYRQFDLPAADPNLCRNYCANDGQCRAFTYVVPGVQGPYARCWLKSAVPPPVARNCCVSGVKAAPPAPVPTPPPASVVSLTGKWNGPAGLYEFVEYPNHTFTWSLGAGPVPAEFARGTVNGNKLTATWGPYPSGTGWGSVEGEIKEWGPGGLPIAMGFNNGGAFRRVGF